MSSATGRIKIEEVIAAVRAAGRTGAFMGDVARVFAGRTKTAKQSIGNALSRAGNDGTLAWVSDPGPSAPMRRRYFALEFAPAVVGQATMPLPKSAPKKVAALQAPSGPAIVPPGLKVTVLPSAPVYSRHQLPPGARVIGGFASLGPGRYLDASVQ